MMLKGETLQKVLEILRETEGYFCFKDEAGEEFVVARKRDFGGESSGKNSEKQLELGPLPGNSAGQATTSLAEAVRQTAEQFDTTPAFVLDSINREIARYSEEEREREIDDLSIEAGKDRPRPPKRFGKKIRFEPITGDLSPELQE